MPGSPSVVVPVAVALADPLGREVAGYVESELGWQVVAAEGPPRPTLRLVGVGAACAGAVVVVEGPPDPEDEQAARAAGALAVLAWPTDRDRLRDLAAQAGRRSAPDGPPVVRVAGVGGGVGTSTVALAVAGLLAWSSKAVVVVGDDGLCRLCGFAPWDGPGAAEVVALDPSDAGVEVGVLARPVAGVAGLRVLGGGPVVDAPGWDADVVVVDAGPARLQGGPATTRPALVDAADLLVAAPDGRLAAATSTSTPVLLCGDGPLDDRAAARCLGRQPVGRLPRSVRVAQAGVAARVPAGLPGAWLRALSGVLVALDGPGR